MSARRHPSDIQDSRLLGVLERYVPAIIARSIVERARREAASGPDVSWTDPNGLLDRISVGVRLFAAPEHVAPILRGITDLAASDQETPVSRSFAEDPPSSSMKAPEPRPAAWPPREEQPPTRRDVGLRDLPNPREMGGPPSSSGFGGPLSRREPFLGMREPVPPSRDVPPSKEFPSSREISSRETSSRDIPSREMPTAREGGLRDTQEAPRRDTEVARRDTEASRAPNEPPPPLSRGVYPTGARFAPRAGGRGPAIVAIPAIPRAPKPADARELGLSFQRRPTPPAGTPIPQFDRAIATATHQSLPRAVVPGQKQPAPREMTIMLLTEHDIPRARQVARDICEALGTRALTQQRLVTIVSELGRNMVLYAGGGKITLRPPTGVSRRVTVLAVDAGPGIPNLPEIMAGKYKSRSGLGLGILGTKRLADAFHIDTGRTGTAITVEVIV